MAKGLGREDKACAKRAAIPAFFMLLTAERATARRQGRQHQKPRLRVFKGPFMDRGMPDFTGKLKEDDVAKIQAFILSCSFPASLQSRPQSD